MRWSLLLAAMVLFIGCRDPVHNPITDSPSHQYEPPERISFQAVSQPYVDQYGPPEDVYEYVSADYHSIDYWWWSQGFEVTFLDTTYDEVYGWTVDSTYSFPPII